MNCARATHINDILVMAWMYRNKIGGALLPDPAGVSLTEAIEATRIVAARPPKRDPDRPGVSVMTCHLAPSRVQETWFWVVQAAYERRIEADKADYDDEAANG